MSKGKSARLKVMVTIPSSRDRILQKGSQLGVLEMINSVVTLGYITSTNSATSTKNGDFRGCRCGGTDSTKVNNSEKWDPP